MVKTNCRVQGMAIKDQTRRGEERTGQERRSLFVNCMRRAKDKAGRQADRQAGKVDYCLYLR